MSRKRDKPYFTRPERAPYPKRRRPHPTPTSPDPESIDDHQPSAKPPPPPAILAMGLPPDCSVLDLKSRFEIYGAISRIRIDRDGVGVITYRSRDSAESAMAASLDASFGITFDSKRVQVLWSTDPLAQWREAVGAGGKKASGAASTSKLLRAEVPLRRHGRVNKLASAIVNPKSTSSTNNDSHGGDGGGSTVDAPFKGREIIAYDDIL
ncbi:hypothetical protein Tsubulata_042379 [Turnera subulata]|uniref:RRM domain-containing protein n=1 Tax=Turnera subulata TaxID=218843 RepID=A0A9Q0F1C7_9ROSI|nr:hypothetical protein Tsubulata_042379 [Turnera subulata]